MIEKIVKTESAYLAGGCFWCLESVFSHVRGVISSVSGYAGGTSENPTYDQVSTGMTGYAETVQVVFDPQVISFEDILSIFGYIHDPSSLNRQGNDIGSQYRSAIFYVDDGQKIVAEKFLAGLRASGEYENPIATELAKLEKFYRAEEYHQRYFEKNPDQAYCQIVIAPKLEKFKAAYQRFFRS